MSKKTARNLRTLWYANLVIMLAAYSYFMLQEIFKSPPRTLGPLDPIVAAPLAVLMIAVLWSNSLSASSTTIKTMRKGTIVIVLGVVGYMNAFWPGFSFAVMQIVMFGAFGIMYIGFGIGLIPVANRALYH